MCLEKCLISFKKLFRLYHFEYCTVFRFVPSIHLHVEITVYYEKSKLLRKICLQTRMVYQKFSLVQQPIHVAKFNYELFLKRYFSSGSLIFTFEKKKHFLKLLLEIVQKIKKCRFLKKIKVSICRKLDNHASRDKRKQLNLRRSDQI